MKRTKLMKDIAKQAKASGTVWEFVRQGGSHEVWRYGTLQVTVPRHADINEITAKAILKDIEEEA